MAYWEAVGAMHRLELLRRIKARELMADPDAPEARAVIALARQRFADRLESVAVN